MALLSSLFFAVQDLQIRSFVCDKSLVCGVLSKQIFGETLYGLFDFHALNYTISASACAKLFMKVSHSKYIVTVCQCCISLSVETQIFLGCLSLAKSRIQCKRKLKVYIIKVFTRYFFH